MAILREMPFTITADLILKPLGERGERPELRDAAEQAATIVQELASPRAAYDFLTIDSVQGEYGQVHADGKPAATLHLGPNADLLAPAKEALVWVMTLGAGPEERVNELFASGDSLLAYLTDSAAVIGLGLASDNLHQMIEGRAASRGWGVGKRLAPGSLVGWPVKEQAVITKLVDCTEIGVTLSSSNLLSPHKSASGLVGIGPGYEEHTVGRVCYLCSLRDTCWRHHA